MATQQSLTCISAEAGSDLSAKQYRFVDMASDAAVDAVSAAGGDAIGVLQNAPLAGEAASVAVMGVAKVVAGGTITAGDRVQSDANGEALTAASGDIVLGRALKGGAAGDVLEILLVSAHIAA